MSNQDWYELTEGPSWLRGDVLKDCPVFAVSGSLSWPPEVVADIEVEAKGRVDEPHRKGIAVKTIEMEDVQHEFSALCQEVASTGQAVVVTRAHEPLVSIVPLPRTNVRRDESVWGLRRQFEACHGVLTEDFDLPSREIDAGRWEDPFKD